MNLPSASTSRTQSNVYKRMLALTRRPSVWILLAVGVLIMLSEIDRLVAGTLTRDGQTHSLGDIIGPFALAQNNLDAWTDWGSLQPTPLILAYAFIDLLLFAPAVGLVLWRVVRQSLVARRLVYAFVAVNWVQAIALALTTAAPGIRIAVATAATIKWMVLVAVVITAARNAGIRSAIARQARRVWLAVYVHRLSLAALLPLAILGLVPAADVLDQLPDAERAWLDSGITLWHGVVAIAFTLGLSATLLMLGRLRSQRVTESFAGGESERDRATFWWWCAGPAVSLVALAILVVGESLTTGEIGFTFVDWPSYWAFVIIFLAPVAISLLIRLIVKAWNERRARGGKEPVTVWSPPPRLADTARSEFARTTGDVLAALVVTIGAFGLVRSFTAPLFLQLVVVAPAPVWKTWVFLLLVLIGLVVGVFSVRIFTALVPASVPTGLPSQRIGTNDNSAPVVAVRRKIYLSVFAGAAVTLAALVIFPREISGILGIVGTCLLAITCWSAVIGIGIIQMQTRQPMEVFRVFHMRANPVLTLVVIVPLAISQLISPAALHAVQVSGARLDLSDGRPTLDSAFGTWLTQSDACDREIAIDDTTITVRPLVVVAAAGGGIRAATWTSNAFTEIARAGSCARSAVMMSSGTSGGSVGLSLFRNFDADDAAEADSVDRDVESLSYPSVLGGTVVGTFVGDNVAGLTGLRVPSRASTPGQNAEWIWQDRAALMESAWQETANQLAEPYDLKFQQPTGWLILNSTDAGRKCRVLISQIDLNEQQRTNPTICQTRTAELPASIDLIDAYKSCPFAMDWATAAMLSARFPFVTPGGRISASTVSASNCDVADMQLVDGGYFEASGLETISDLAPQLARLVSDQNLKAQAGDGPFVVPIVTFLDNGPGADIAENPTPLSAEIAVPLVGRSASKLQVTPGTWIQRISNSFDAICPAAPESDETDDSNNPPPPVDACQRVRDELRKALPDGVVVVAPKTEPSIEAPLGWTLSQQSRTVLCSKLQQQLDTSALAPTRPAKPYGSLAALLHVLEPEESAYALNASTPVTPLCRTHE